jgi:hypothetical protein
MVLGVALAVYFGVHSPRWQVPPETRKSKPSLPTSPPTLHDLFKTDFSTLLKYSVKPKLVTPLWSQEIDGQIHIDFSGKSMFVGYFIPD